MPRHRRVAVAGWPHHIVQRGHNRGPVFGVDADYRAYFETLIEWRERLALKVFAWCLMTNHVHLVIDPGEDQGHLSVLMKHLAGRHARRMNRVLQRTGPFWEGRYRCSLIERNSYLLACLRYVEVNPVRAGIVTRPEDYQWSSYGMRMGIVDGDWLDEDPAYLAMAESAGLRRRRYAEFVVQQETEDELSMLRTALRRNQVTARHSSLPRWKNCSAVSFQAGPRATAW